MNLPAGRRERLADGVFSYQATKEDKVFRFWHGRRAMILRGQRAARFLLDIQGLEGQEEDRHAEISDRRRHAK